MSYSTTPVTIMYGRKSEIITKTISMFKIKKITTLGRVKAGSLFLHDGTIALKSEYQSNEGFCYAYILGTGEVFHGAGTRKEQDELLVTELKLKL